MALAKGCSQMDVRVENLYLWCSVTPRKSQEDPLVVLWGTVRFLYAELVHVFLFTGSSKGEGVNGDAGKGRR